MEAISPYQKVKHVIIGKFVVNNPNDVVTMQATKTDLNYEQVTGIMASIVGTDDTALQNSNFQKFQIDSQDVFPVGFEVKIIATGLLQAVSPNDKYYEVRDGFGKLYPYRAKGSLVDITYKDGGSAKTYPYTLNVYLKHENLEANAEEESFFTWLRQAYKNYNSKK